MSWFKKAADQGDGLAHYFIGTLYSQGKGASKDYSQAFRWFELGANKGEVMAQAALGAMYEKGQGTRKDIVRALMYYELVIERFDRRTWQYRDVFISKRRVGTLMTAEQISEAKQLSKNWTKENPVDGNR